MSLVLLLRMHQEIVKIAAQQQIIYFSRLKERGSLLQLKFLLHRNTVFRLSRITLIVDVNVLISYSFLEKIFMETLYDQTVDFLGDTDITLINSRLRRHPNLALQFRVDKRSKFFFLILALVVSETFFESDINRKFKI